MKNALSILMILAFTTTQSQEDASELLAQELFDHFEEFRPEVFRYSKLSDYGKKQEEIGEEQIQLEGVLCERVLASDLVKNPTEDVLSLMHNMLIHSPDQGKELLLALNEEGGKGEILGELYLEAIFTGEFGEKMALGNLEKEDEEWSLHWAKFLAKNAIYDSSVPKIKEAILNTSKLDKRQELISALSGIGSLASVDFIKDIIDSTASDQLQATAIYSYTNLLGLDAKESLSSIKPVGELSMLELKSSLKFIEKQTSDSNKYGIKVANDLDFISRHSNIKCPAFDWLNSKGLMNESEIYKARPFTPEEKDEFLETLIKSKGFGLAAAQASLFKSLEKTDLEKLLELRSQNYYSTNRLTAERNENIDVLIRHVKRLD